MSLNEQKHKQVKWKKPSTIVVDVAEQARE
jgi:hypothetical protein